MAQCTGERAVGQAERIRQLDDSEFLDERRRVREALEHAPADAVGRAELAALHDTLTEEFDRRARAAWTPGD